jgi:hypothetical protein
MSTVRAVVSAFLAAQVALTSCGPSGPAQSAQGNVARRDAKIVNATIVTNGCQNLGAESARLAERAMYDLIEACSSVPGGVARFHATLQPGGHIEITAGPGQPQVIPICVVKHSLLHKVRLVGPCGLDVRLEETSVTMARDGAAP